MEANEKFEYWLDIAQYDLSVAETMQKSEHWLYVVFMCQQAIEKLMKGLYSYYMPDTPPHLHNIRAIAERLERSLSEVISEERLGFFDELTAYYLNNRYPDYISKLTEQIKNEKAKEVLKKTKEVFSWLLTLKP